MRNAPGLANTFKTLPGPVRSACAPRTLPHGPQPWFPNSVWEPPLGKLRFPSEINVRETEFREEAFPNGVWERGVERSVFTEQDETPFDTRAFAWLCAPGTLQ